MKKTISIIVVAILVFSLASCHEQTVVSVNVEDKEALSDTVIGTDALTEIGNNLYYDRTTRIVYWWNERIGKNSYCATTPTPYYAPNGLPYKYDPETNTFEEIERGE